MPVNLDALKRYHILNECFSNKYGKYTIEKLIKKCSNDIGHDVKERTIREDIKNMRSGDLGYEAPIVIDKQTKCYHYSDPNFSIKNCTLNSQAIKDISFAISILKEYKGFNFFESFNGIFDKLETDIHLKTKESVNKVIDFEKFNSRQGLQFLNQILDAIINQNVLNIEYQSFVNEQAISHQIHPYYLKEYQHRWYVMGLLKSKGNLITLALDRIKSVKIAEIEVYKPNTEYDFNEFFNHVIGITAPTSTPEDVILSFTSLGGKYFKSQPFYPEYEILIENDSELRVKMNLHINFELEKVILANLSDLKVIEPISLKESIEEKITNYLEK